MIKNIVFDLGGVVVNYSPRKYLESKFSNLELENYLYDLTFGSRAWRRMDLGVLDRETAESDMLKKARADGKLFEAQTVLDEWRYMMTPKNDTISLIKTLKIKGYKVYYLSNIPEDVFTDFCENYSFMSLFEGGVASYDVNMLKPQQEIYRLLLDKFSLFAVETI
ncbi:MAG: HAD hydrolase-like protein, partial [Oscillospiraceae bacterium]